MDRQLKRDLWYILRGTIVMLVVFGVIAYLGVSANQKASFNEVSGPVAQGNTR